MPLNMYNSWLKCGRTNWFRCFVIFKCSSCCPNN